MREQPVGEGAVAALPDGWQDVLARITMIHAEVSPLPLPSVNALSLPLPLPLSLPQRSHHRPRHYPSSLPCLPCHCPAPAAEVPLSLPCHCLQKLVHFQPTGLLVQLFGVLKLLLLCRSLSICWIKNRLPPRPLRDTSSNLLTRTTTTTAKTGQGIITLQMQVAIATETASFGQIE